MGNNISIREWQQKYANGDFSAKDCRTQIEAGWHDWFCGDDALAGRLKRLAGVVTGIRDPFILDNYYVWFKNNCPMSGPLYDDVRFEPLDGERNGRYFLVTHNSPHEDAPWVLHTERHGFEEPEFSSGSLKEIVAHINKMGPEMEALTPEQTEAPDCSFAMKGL